MSVDPLFAALLLRLGNQDHVLILAMDHVIADGFSSAILARDIWATYIQLARGLRLTLPKCHPIPRLCGLATADCQMVDDKHGAYWEERLRMPRVFGFPAIKSWT